jgi:hypothetical protein
VAGDAIGDVARDAHVQRTVGASGHIDEPRIHDDEPIAIHPRERVDARARGLPMLPILVMAE